MLVDRMVLLVGRRSLMPRRAIAAATFAALSSTSLCTKTLAWSLSAKNMSTVNEQGGSTAQRKSAPVSFRNHVVSQLDNSWIAQLQSETEENLSKSRKRTGLDETDGNQTRRPVFNGHYVPVRPTPLPNPRLVLWSGDVALNVLGLTKEQVESEEFLNYVSGNEPYIGESWATPYALSIMGTRYTNNCPYGTGDGYGDGRAVSIGEFNGNELQLKGGGQTPFCRGADGRAVLRSSIREFLASEAMHHLGVPTTRALSLVVSETETVQRPWYRDESLFGTGPAVIDEDDPRLAQYGKEERQRIIRQVRRQYKSDPNVMVSESAAITCRVCRSFTRIGHIDLFARRAEKASMTAASGVLPESGYYTDSPQWKELEQLIWHACYREFRELAYDPYKASDQIGAAATVMLQQSAQRLAAMAGHWIRVGFAQGNFNADNCLIAGNTMDYGPFGFLEEYDPLFAKWTGSGQHFGFMNQVSAAYANYQVLVESVVPVIANRRGESSDIVQDEFMEPAATLFRDSVSQVFRRKLGFSDEFEPADTIWKNLEALMRQARVDWTILFRELSYLVRDHPEITDATVNVDLDMLLDNWIGSDAERDGSSFLYENLSENQRSEWKSWLHQWQVALAGTESNHKIVAQMLSVNPKYVLREWMLVKAYQGAAKNEEAELFALYDLIQRPYEEGSADETAKYYRRAPEAALLAGGTAFMS